MEKAIPETPGHLNYFCIMYKVLYRENNEKLEFGNYKMPCVTDDKQEIGQDIYLTIEQILSTSHYSTIHCLWHHGYYFIQNTTEVFCLTLTKY